MSGGELFSEFAAAVRPEIEQALDELLPAADRPPVRLHQAMRYSVFAGGKRLRPTLVLLASELLGAPRTRALPGAAALEAIHTYSLVHDDLPALDDDDLRRGRPTAHRAYDEATAILLGDSLLTLGLTTLARLPADLAAGERARAVVLIGDAIGTDGMIGGQAEDLAAESGWPGESAPALERIHLGKTAALIAASLRLGGLYAGVAPEVDRGLGELGQSIGLLFQIRDDLLDVEGTSGMLGKTPGKDARRHKLTYPALFGAEPSRRRLAELGERAHARAEDLLPDAKLLTSLIAYLSERTS